MKHFMLICLLTAAFSALRAQSSLITVDDAVAKAIAQSLPLKREAVDLETARRSAANIWSQLFPEISLGASAGYNADGFSPRFSTGLTFRFHAGLPAGMKLIKEAYKTNLLSYEDSKKKLETAVRRQFWSLLTQKAGIAVLKYRYDMAVQQFEASEQGYNIGSVSLLSMEENRLEVGKASLALKQAETDMKTAMGGFFVSLGNDWGAQTELSGILVVRQLSLDAENLIARYLANNPDVVMKKRALDTARTQRSQSVWQNRTPSLSLGGSYGGGISVPYTGSFSATVNVSIPIEAWIPGTAGNQSVRKAAAEEEKAVIDLEIAQNNVKNTIRGLVFTLDGDWDSVEIARLGVGVAERTLAVTIDAHNQGSIDNLTLIGARHDLTAARQELLKAELSYKNTVLDLVDVLNITELELGHY